MYDFYFGTKSEIDNNKRDWLLFIKRMLPRWCNSIPDSEYEAISEILSSHCNKDKPVLVETGCGASTIAMLNYVLENDGVLFTWDTNSLKASHIRSVCMETLGRHYSKKNLWNHWKFIGYSSCCPYAGLSILKELNHVVDFCFLDSEHTLQVLSKEVSALAGVLKEKSIVAIDDANYNYRTFNEAYINMTRTKLGLKKITDFGSENLGSSFADEVFKQLNSLHLKCKKIENNFASNVTKDIFFDYFKGDRKSMNKIGMEKMEELTNRFEAWKIIK